MEHPSPPKTMKTKKQFNRPFYESTKKTSAEIISEARSSVKTLETKRPFTPADGRRRLFGSARTRDAARPPSVVSIASSYNDSRPPTGRLSPIDGTIPESKSPDDSYLSDESNELDINRNLQKENPIRKPSFKECLLPTSPDALGKLLSKANLSNDKDTRRVQSGPKERTALDILSNNIVSRSSSTSSLSTSKSDKNLDIVKHSSNENIKSTSSLDKSLIYFEENLKPLLQQMRLNHLHEDVDSLIVNFDMLWKTLEIGSLLGKSKLPSKRRSEILSTVYQCTPNDHPLLQLKLAKIFIAMEVSGKNMEAACKLVFKTSRDKNNDTLFAEEKLIGMMVTLLSNSNLIDQSESLVYLIGAVKFLLMNEQSKKGLIKNNIVEHVTKLLLSIKEIGMGRLKTHELNNILVQLLSLLNNIVDQPSLVQEFVDNDIMDIILPVSQHFTQDTEYSLSLSRLLSKLSLNHSVCLILAKEKYLIINMDILLKNYKNQELAVRQCYMFGNLANLNEEVRSSIASFKDVLLKVLVFYSNELNKTQKKADDMSTCSQPDIEDTLVKTLRVFANVSIEAAVGHMLADEIALIDKLLHLAESSLKLKLGNELIVTIAATINNLSYFMHNTYLCSRQLEFTDALIKVLFIDSMECVLEVVRVFGNFTQSRNVRQRLISIFEVLVSLLDANNGELIFATCGVLINLMVDKENRPLLKEFDGISNLIECLRDFAESDWLLAGMICQIFWNYSEFLTNSSEYFGEENIDDFIALLSELTDPEVVFNNGEPHCLHETSMELSRKTWSDHFLPVASLLLERLEKHHCMLEPIITEPD